MRALPALVHPRDLRLMIPVALMVAGAQLFGAPGPSWRDGDGATWPAGGRPAEQGPFGHDGGPPGLAPLDPVALLLAASAVLAMGLRRRPRVAALLSTTATAALLGLGDLAGPELLAVAITSWSLARRDSPPRSAVVAGIAGGVLVIGCLLGTGLSGASAEGLLDALLASLPVAAWVVVPFLVGLVRSLSVEANRRRRAEEERRVLDAERVRLASEVHDVVGHGLAAIQMQAEIALHVADRRPEQALESLQVISRASAEALAELRATLAEIAPDIAAQDARATTPGLERLGDLCGRMREAGIAVDLEMPPPPSEGSRRGTLSLAADVAAYRIVQESLTNVVKHAAERRAAVRVRTGEDGLEILVRSSAAPATQVVPGFGIAGMQRRAADVGGSCEVDVRGREVVVRGLLPYVDRRRG